MLGLRPPEVFQQLMGADEIDPVAVLDAAHAQSNGQMGLPDAGRTEQQHVGRFRDERQTGELADLTFVDGRLEGEVEVLEGALEREMSQACPGDKVPLTPGSHFDAEQIGEEVRVRQLAFRRGFQPWLQHLGGLGEAQLLQVFMRLGQGDHEGAPTSAS
jgi:hypothetical protein